jgi:transcriptional regulator with XRE-family HTH domain
MPQRPKENLVKLNLNSETIGQRIARIRKEKGLTQKQLAEKIGITRPRLSNYEIDRIRLFDEMVIRFAIALEVGTDEILGFKNTDKNKKSK